MRQTRLSEILLRWFDDNQRDLPWRSSKEPYLIWLSEVILQQTQVAQGLPYFLKFQSKFPTVLDLAQAKEQEVLKAWEGLGYYSRARNLHKAAIEVATNHNGIFPTTALELQKLPGVGAYTSRAISSICHEEKVSVVDGNVYRVLSRYFGVDLAINETPGIKYFKALSQEILPEERIGDYNQAIMEFGALMCTPKLPNCVQCPVQSSCWAMANKAVMNLPVKSKKVKIRKRYFNYLIYLNPLMQTRIIKRSKGGIWQELYEFPLIESDDLLEAEALKKQIISGYKSLIYDSLVLINQVPIEHKLTHQHIFANFWLLKTELMISDFVPLSEVNNYPLPQLIVRFLKNFEQQIG